MMAVDNCNGKVIKDIRRCLGLTQKQFGKVVGRRQEQISRWENSTVKPEFGLDAMLTLDKMLGDVGKRLSDFTQDDR
ncbi:hypothetical protein Lepto7376_3122 [[Leptolyngbya] sp. PCC 7376]|nr:hypothetical protein Lepto7376_3122 [[Leptolyngbya] sp. PCC 7376]